MTTDFRIFYDKLFLLHFDKRKCINQMSNFGFIEKTMHQYHRRITSKISKGQIKPKSRLGPRRFYQKNKRTNLICLPWRVKKQTKQIRPFVFWENLARQFAFEIKWPLADSTQNVCFNKISMSWIWYTNLVLSVQSEAG